MNNLKVYNYEGKFVTDSRDVAEMTGKDHKNLLRDIEGYSKIMESSTLSSGSAIDVADFFIKHEYQIDDQGKHYPCYLVTRKGCDMVANKMTGAKGVLFTAEYVTRFEEMEKFLSPVYSNLSKELQAIIMLDQKMILHNVRLTNLENNMTVDYGQQLVLQNIAKARALIAMGGLESLAYKNKSLSKKVFAAVYRDLKTYLQINSYRNTAVMDFEKAKNHLMDWKPQGDLARGIENVNIGLTIDGQIKMAEVF